MTVVGLPEGWIQTSIGDVADVISGGTPSSSNPENFAAAGTCIAWLTPADLSGYKKKYISHGARDLSVQGYSSSSARKIPRGSILFSSRAPIGYVAIADNEISTNQGFKNFVFSAGVCPEYSYYYCISIRSLAESLGTGTTFKEISGSASKTLPFLLPPLAEQHQIAEKIDGLLAQVDRLKARLDSIPATLKSFRQSVLAAAVSGKLTEDWRMGNACFTEKGLDLIVQSERKNKGIKVSRKVISTEFDSVPFDIPESWTWKALGDIALKITDGAHNTPQVLNKGFPYLMAKDLTGGMLDFSENRFISESEHAELYSKCKPEKGDLLIVNIGAGTGNNVLIDVDFEFSFKNIAIIKRPSFIEPNFLKYFYDAEKQRIFNEQTRGGAQPFLSLTVLNGLLFALPPNIEQIEIVRRVEHLFAYADQIEQRVKDAQTRVNSLTQSILAKAFRGELTAEWREQNPDLISGENSAAALLDRIKAERAAQANAKKPRGKAKAIAS